MLKEETYFSDDNIFKIISDILWKNGIDETPADSADKILQHKKSFIMTVYKLVKDLSSQKISDSQFSSELQNKTSIALPIAHNILNEIKEKILPYAEKITIGSEIQKEKPIVAVPPIESQNFLKNDPIKNYPTAPVPEEVIKLKPRKVLNSKKEKEPEIKKILRTGPDNYREPIE
ncbi:MAG: hypothetical protein NTV36_00205 [Candidatus Staskawiczbacteria bacterium]|nr:hypothetical protein [Candidatus Staskawiczbacteria bacterium]